MEAGQLISIAAIIIGLFTTVISGLIGLVLKGNSADRKTIKESIVTETKDRKQDIIDMKESIENETDKVHRRCHDVESDVKADKEKRHESDLKIMSELSEIKTLMAGINAKLEALS